MELHSREDQVQRLNSQLTDSPDLPDKPLLKSMTWLHANNTQTLKASTAEFDSKKNLISDYQPLADLDANKADLNRTSSHVDPKTNRI